MQTDSRPGAIYIPALARMSDSVREILDILGNRIVTRVAISSLIKQAKEDSPAVRYIAGNRLECFVTQDHHAAIKAAVSGELPGIRM
jgi:hypothetical protein